MELEEIRRAMKSGKPVTWDGRGTSVGREVTYSFVRSLTETYDKESDTLQYSVTLIDKNRNSSMTADPAAVRYATPAEVIAYMTRHRDGINKEPSRVDPMHTL